MTFFTVLAYSMLFIAASQANLKDDLKEFCDLIPKNKIMDIGIKYFLYDDEFKDLINYSKNPEVAREWHELTNHQEVKKLIDYLEKNDVDINKATCEFYTLIENNQVPNASYYMADDEKITGGVIGFIEDVKAAVPTDDLLSLANAKIKNSPPARELYQKVCNVIELDPIRETTQNWFNTSIAKIKSFGVDVDNYIKNFFSCFGRNSN